MVVIEKRVHLQRPCGDQAPDQEFLAQADLQHDQHGYWHHQDQEVSDDVQVGVGEEQGLKVDPGARGDERVPQLGDGVAGEELGQADGDHVAGGDEQDEPDLEFEFPFRVDPKVEDQNGHFGQPHGGGIHDVCCCRPLGSRFSREWEH